jgi:transcriptional regulator with GAF, ATPase, and Fis domain
MPAAPRVTGLVALVVQPLPRRYSPGRERCARARRATPCRTIEDALRECGAVTGAAERLGLTRQNLQQMLRRRRQP